MTCQACGAPQAAGVRFCSRCGAGVAPTPEAGAGYVPPAGAPLSPGYGAPQYAYGGPAAMVRPPRVAQHVRTLGILWVCFGVWRVVSGLIGMFFLSAFTSRRFGGMFGFPFPRNGHMFPPEWMSFMVPMIAAGTVVAAALAFATAYGLLNRTSWGRIVAIIAAVLSLIKFPLGTVLGIFTLWVLGPRDSGVEYDHLAATSGI